jgi:hypothetical protein
VSSSSQNDLKTPRPEQMSGQIVTGIWLIILAGAITGLCLGLVRFQSEMDRAGSIPIAKGLTCAGLGALFGFLAGIVVWGFAKEIGWGIVFLRVLAIALVVAGIGAGIGWGEGADANPGRNVAIRDRPRGMLNGAIIGAGIGLILGLMNLRAKAAGRFRTIHDETKLSGEQAETNSFDTTPRS